MVDTDTHSQYSAGTESKFGYPVLEGTSYLRPIHGASSRFVSLELRRSVIPQDDWPTHPPIHTHRPAGAERPPLPVPPPLCAAPIPLYANGNPPPHSRSNTDFRAYPLISEPDPHSVAMPILTQQHEDVLINAHYGLSFGFPQGEYMVGCPSVPSQSIAMPIVPTFLATGASGHMIPDFPLDPTLGQSPRHPSQHVSSPDSTGSLSPSRNFDSPLYFSPSPLSMGNHAHIASPPQMLDQVQSQPHMTQSTGQHYSLTVPLEGVEFPPISGSGEVPFFQCRWADCGMWITSEKEAVKDHLICIHNVELKGRPADLESCKWVGCSSSLQRSGLVRHFRTHLGLKWGCSVCKATYTRQDSVGYHARKEPQCEVARAISYPSTAAYSARINEDSTVTLTKMLQP